MKRTGENTRFRLFSFCQLGSQLTLEVLSAYPQRTYVTILYYFEKKEQNH